MRVLDMEQGSPAWFTARLGRPTASRYGEIYTGTGKASTSAQGYMDELNADWLAGVPTDSFEGNFWTDRGTELEAQARAGYEWDTDNAVIQVGCCWTDDGMTGGSPDGLIGDDGGLEIKCPKAKTLVSYLRNGGIPTKYIPQVQGYMMITGRAWWDFYAWHPKLPALLVRVERDEEYICNLHDAVMRFVEKMLKQRDQLKGNR